MTICPRSISQGRNNHADNGSSSSSEMHQMRMAPLMDFPFIFKLRHRTFIHLFIV
jgi:hypothetical protein